MLRLLSIWLTADFADDFVMIVTHARLTNLLLKDPTNPSLTKHTRKHQLDSLDGLHRNDAFLGSISINDFRIRTSIRHSRPNVEYDINNDSDGEVDDDFYTPVGGFRQETRGWPWAGGARSGSTTYVSLGSLK
jgi:hypothetical protein